MLKLSLQPRHIRLIGSRPDVDYIKARSIDNPKFPLEYYERMRITMDERRFRSLFGGEWEKMEGLVYDCFDDQENTIDPFLFPSGTKFIAGVDWGTTAPFSLTVRAITPKGEHFQPSEVYKTGLTISTMIKVAQDLKRVYPIEMFYCDPSSPGYIMEFNNAGLTSTPADNQIRLGIDLHYQLIKERRFKLFRGDNRHSIDEYETYHYPSDREISQDTKIVDNLPIKQNDHAMDSARYVTIATFKGYHRHEPRVISQLDEKKHLSIEERRQRLYQPANERFEEW